MYNNKRSVMGKWKRILIAVALTASVILALPVWDVGSAEAAPFDMDTKCTLTVKRAGEDAALQGNVEVDLYKVADAEDHEGYDAYTLELKSDYSAVSDQLINAMKVKKDSEGNLIMDPSVDGVNEDYRRLAQDVARIALGVETKEDETGLVVKNPQKSHVTQTISGDGRGSFGDLEPGMYLVVAHGTGMTAAQYTDFISANVADKEAPAFGAAGQQIVTKAYSDGYTYTYLPELISLPMRGIDNEIATGNFNTSSTDPWQPNVIVELKSERSQEMVSLRINKNFVVGGNQTDLVGQTSSVFEIEAKVGDLVVYSNTVEISSNGDGFVELRKVIPVDASVTITEVYDGAGYGLAESSQREQRFTAVSDIVNGAVAENNTVSFTNNYNGNDIGGDIITNGFEPGENSWKWYKDGVETTAGSLSAPPAADQ